MSTTTNKPRLADKYKLEVVPALMKKFSYKTVMQAPKLSKICLNRGVNDRSFDGRGNYTLGVTEQIIFPEIDIDKVNKITGLDITFVTTANTNEEAFELLKELGMPFKNVKKTV